MDTWQIRSENANSEDLQVLLRAGWEPFAVTAHGMYGDYTKVWLRRRG